MTDRIPPRAMNPEGVADGDYALSVAGGIVTGLTPASSGTGGGGGGAAVTAWTPLPLASGILSHADNFGFPPQYRKVGDEVQLRGVVRRSSGSFGTGNTLIATLPVGFRPTDPGGGAVTPVIYAASASSGAISTRIQFNLDGTVYVATAASSAWASISVPGFSTL